jgi:hypothetical protein
MVCQSIVFQMKEAKKRRPGRPLGSVRTPEMVTIKVPVTIKNVVLRLVEEEKHQFRLSCYGKVTTP